MWFPIAKRIQSKTPLFFATQRTFNNSLNFSVK